VENFRQKGAVNAPVVRAARIVWVLGKAVDDLEPAALFDEPFQVVMVESVLEAG
jgi:hypothetical protein